MQTAQDLYSKELTLGGTGSGADTAIYPEFLAALLGMKMKVVKGYKGSHEIHLAMERNEVQGICLAYDLLLRGNLARRARSTFCCKRRSSPICASRTCRSASSRRALPRARGAGAVLRARVHGTAVRGAGRSAG